MRTRITNIALTTGVDREAEIPFIQDAEVQVNGTRIAYAGPRAEAPAFAAEETIDGGGAVCMPGLVNLHTHNAMTLLRSVGAGLALSDWLEQAIFPREKKLTPEIVRVGSDLAAMELMRFGVTSFCDMYFHTDEVAASTRDAGLRALLGYGVVDFDGSCADLLPGLRAAERWHGAAGDRIRVALAPHSEYTTTPTLMRRVAAEAKARDLRVHVHVSETRAEHEACRARREGLTPIRYLEKLGVLDVPAIAAHGVWLTDDDIRVCAERGVTVAHCPVSNLKLASGVAPVLRMLDAGVRVGLGTDGVASNNNLNLWEEMRLMPLLQRGVSLDPLALPAARAFHAATLAGARALGYDDLGLLLPDWRADLILVSRAAPNMTPEHDLGENLVFAAQGSDVTLTMVDGRVLYRDGKYLTLDARETLSRANAAAECLKV